MISRKLLFQLKNSCQISLAIGLICLFGATLNYAQTAGNTPANTASPAVSPNLPDIFVIGDSTANNHANGALGWGDPFAAYFDAARVNVINRARAGRSSRTFQTEGLWDKVLPNIKPGDIVLLQFGHNDGGPLDTDRARGSLPGLGEETQEITRPDGTKEIVHTYGWYMRKYIADTKAKGAVPVIFSLTPRNIWENDKVERGPGQFGAWAAAIAQSQNVAFVDLTNIVADRFEQLGQEKVAALFGQDHTHTSPVGAELNAASVVAGLKGLKDCPICAYLSEKGQTVAALPVKSDAKPRRPLPEPVNPKLPTLFLIGDSTVRNGQGDGAGGQWGWGEPLFDYFDPAKINVVNRAVGGLSSRTYLTGGHWDKVLAMLKPGDFVIMQFGHNDGGALNDDSRARGTIKGSGAESQEIDNLLTKQHETVYTYGWYLRKFIADAKAKGATPIVCSLIPRKIWKDHKIVRNTEDYGKWAKDVAESEHVGFIDLNNIIADKYDRLGEEKVEPLFGDPHTHTSRAGAELNAAAVITGLNNLQPNPFARFYSAKEKSLGKDLAGF